MSWCPAGHLRRRFASCVSGTPPSPEVAFHEACSLEACAVTASKIKKKRHVAPASRRCRSCSALQPARCTRGSRLVDVYVRPSSSSPQAPALGVRTDRTPGSQATTTHGGVIDERPRPTSEPGARSGPSPHPSWEDTNTVRPVPRHPLSVTIHSTPIGSQPCLPLVQDHPLRIAQPRRGDPGRWPMPRGTRLPFGLRTLPPTSLIPDK